MIITYAIVILLIILSATFSGLTLGLMSLNPHDLHRKMRMGNQDARKIYPLRKKGNLLLCTLLVGNVAVNSALAVFLGSITSGFAAGLIATALIVIFGEILPQSIFSRFAIKLGARTTWLVYPFLIVLYPVTKPIAIILDKALGKELPTLYSKEELKLFLEQHKEHKDSELGEHEFEIMKKGLVFSERKVKDVMTPRVNTYFLQKNDVLDSELLAEIQKMGYSRMPVYHHTIDKVVGILYAKELVKMDPGKETKVEKIMRKNLSYVNESDTLNKVLSSFKKKRMHLFIVKDDHGGVAGIITLEDVLEELVGEIVDEHDSIINMGEHKGHQK